LRAAREASRRTRRRWRDTPPGWPTDSPGARNAWLLFVTTKPPSWRDPLHPWPEGPLTVGEPHDGFLYPDPIGFWSEVRRWSLELFRVHEPRWGAADTLSLTALVHVGGDPGHLDAARQICAPRVIVFLDEPAWQAAALEVPTTPLAVPDPHRPGQTYEGWWGTTAEGTVVGKSPQHPTMHRLYAAEDLTTWLRAAPRPAGVRAQG
ncbi:MAG: hypothetical protein ABL966_17060, partial [Acidimicrobiales bacterium]